MKYKSSKGFTLIEMLIVVAIVGILVAIAVPAITTQLEKAREAADAANIRAQYAKVAAQAIETSEDVNVDGADEVIQLTQAVDGWKTKTIEDNLVNTLSVEPGAEPKAKCTAWVEYKVSENMFYLRYGDEAGSAVPAVVDWSTDPIKNAGQKMIAELKSTPGVNRHYLYSSDYSSFTEDQKSIVTEMKKYIDLGDNYVVYFDWTGYPGIRCTVTTSVSAEGQTGPHEYATRVSFDKNGNVTKVTNEFGVWEYWNSKWGFNVNSTYKGVTYPTEIIYES